MKITQSQLNVTVGDILSNKSKIIDFIKKAADNGADRGVTTIVQYEPGLKQERNNFTDL